VSRNCLLCLRHTDSRTCATRRTPESCQEARRAALRNFSSLGRDCDGLGGVSFCGRISCLLLQSTAALRQQVALLIPHRRSRPSTWIWPARHRMAVLIPLICREIFGFFVEMACRTFPYRPRSVHEAAFVPPTVKSAMAEYRNPGSQWVSNEPGRPTTESESLMAHYRKQFVRTVDPALKRESAWAERLVCLRAVSSRSARPFDTCTVEPTR